MLSSLVYTLRSYIFTPTNFTEEQMSNAQTFVDDLIGKHSIVVFSKTYCPYCHRAKALLTEYGVPFHTVELNQLPADLNLGAGGNDGFLIQKYLAQKQEKNHVTVPRIYVNQKLIGGCDDLVALHNNGELKSLFDAVKQ
ncbi:thioredoxin-like protein [Atractiella rhizophila]|nr:thioredoxin-like protein [Atractiella rhizophila]